MNLLDSNSEFIVVHVLRNFTSHRIDPRENPAISWREIRPVRLLHISIRKIHHDKPARVPDLVREVPACLNLLPVEAHVISRSIACHECETQRVRAVLVNDLERINAVAERLRHLPALAVADESVDQHMVERNLTCLLDSREDHSDDPEENDIVAGDQHICRIKILVLRRLLRPTECGERPQCGTEPGIKRLRILLEFCSAAVWAGVRHFLRNDHLSAVLAVIGRDSVPPPQLAGNAPVMDILKPVQIDLVEALRNKGQ